MRQSPTASSRGPSMTTSTCGGNSDEVTAADGTLTTPLADLTAVGLDRNLTKPKLLGTTPDACANKPAWLKETSVITDPIEAAQVAEAEAAAKEATTAA